ncbi:hypothetical protein FS837_003433 [Tulasnella sp. UAMH 9824]|nr:hypothetical protein FS837_003433 [Tulasnella sp. UAMH 9824]
MVGLGESYNTRERYHDAEKALMDAHKIYLRIGNDLGAANALLGLGESYDAQSRYQEAEKAFKEAYETHSCTGNKLRAANALISLGEIYTDHLRYEEAKNAFIQAHEMHYHTDNLVGLARARILLCGIYSTRLDYSKADEAFQDASKILSRLEDEINPKHASNHPEEDCDTQSVYSGEEAEADHHRTEQNAKEANALEEDLASFLAVPVADTQLNRRQNQDLSEELTSITHTPVPATKELIELLQALGKAAPKAVRNKHKIYSILRVSRDICNHIMEIGDPPERQSGSNIKATLTRTEGYFALLDALEEGIHPEISTQFLDAPKTHPVFVVIKGLEYLETQAKCGIIDEPTRELIIDIATLLAQALASTSPDDGDKSLQENDSLVTEADRDWLAQALAE